MPGTRARDALECAARRRPPVIAWGASGGRSIEPPAGLVMPRLQNYPRSFRTACGLWFACDSTLVAACTRIWLRVRLLVSLAKSVSRIALCELDTFSNA